MNTSQKRKLLLSSVFTVLLLVYLFQHISFHEIIQAIKTLPLRIIFIGFLFHLGAYIFRTLTFHSFLKDEKISYPTILGIHFIQNFYVHVIPASLGELSFPILLKDRVKMSKSMAVLLITKAYILLITVFMFFISGMYLIDFLNTIDFRKNITVWVSIVMTLLISVLLVFLMFHKFRKNIKGMIKNNKILEKLYERSLKLYREIESEFIKFKKFLFFLKITIFTVGALLCNIMFYLIILRGLEIHLNILQIFFVSSIGVAFLILPIKSIGGFGTTEGSWAIGLVLLGMAKENSITAGFVIHALALINVFIFYLIGLGYSFLLNPGRNSNKIKENEK